MDFTFELPLTINGRHVTDVEMIAVIERGYDPGDWFASQLSAVWGYAGNQTFTTVLRSYAPDEMSFEAQVSRAAHKIIDGELAERISQLFAEEHPDWLPSNDEHRLRTYELV